MGLSERMASGVGKDKDQQAAQVGVHRAEGLESLFVLPGQAERDSLALDGRVHPSKSP